MVKTRGIHSPMLMSNRKFLRIYIAEYESMRAWTGGETANVFKSRIKPYDLFLLYQLGINPLLTESYKHVIDELADQCILKDVTQMSDRDICQDMLNQINHYAVADTQIYFLYADRYFSEIRGRIRVGAGVSTSNTYRTGQVRIPESYRYLQKEDEKDTGRNNAQNKTVQRNERPVQKNKDVQKQLIDDRQGAEVTSAKVKTNQPKTNQQEPKSEPERGGTGSNNLYKKKKKKKRPGGNPPQNSNSTNQAGKDQKPQRNPSQEKEKPALPPKSASVHPSAESPDKAVQAQAESSKTQKSPEGKGRTAFPPPKASQNSIPSFMSDELSSVIGMMVSSFPAQVDTSTRNIQENQSAESDVHERQKEVGSKKEGAGRKDAGDYTEGIPEPSGEEAPVSRKSLPPDDDNEFDAVKAFEEQLDRERENTAEETPSVEQKPADPSEDATGQENPEEKKAESSWSEVTRAQREEFQQQKPLTEAQKKDARLRALERKIFDSDHQVIQRERYYSPLEDHRASYIADLADRLIMDINRLVKGVSEMGLDFDAYMAMISTLVQSTSLEDFQNCWSVVYPGRGIKMSMEEYRKLQKEALYYVETCEQLYLKDQWDA